MNLHRLLAAAALALPLISPAQSNPAPPLEAHLPEPALARQILMQHPAVRAARAQAEAQRSRADITQNGAAEFTTRLSQQRRRASDPNERYAETSLGVERPVRAWGKASIDADLAEQERNAALLNVNDALHETSRELLQRWLELQRATVRREEAIAQVALAQELSRQAEGRLRRGDVSRLDASLAQAELQRAQAARDLADAAHATAVAQLMRSFPGLETQTRPLPDTARLATDYAQLPLWPQLRQQLLERHHGLQLLRAETARQNLQARRADRDRYPDPTLGVFAARERGGAENLVGVSISIPWPGQLRQNLARATAAEARSADERLVLEETRLGAEFEARYLSLGPMIRAAESLETAAQTQRSAADKSARAYELGEHSMTELVQNRRLAAEQRSQALLARLDALHGLAALLLDLHVLWDLDE